MKDKPRYIINDIDPMYEISPIQVELNNTTFSLAHDALNRMKNAHKKGKGCLLTNEMLNSLSVTIIGDMWAEPDPRESKGEDR